MGVGRGDRTRAVACIWFACPDAAGFAFCDMHASTLALPHCGCPWAQGVCDCTPAFIIMYVCMFAVTDMGFRGYLHACLLSSARTSTHTHTHKLTRARARGTWTGAGVQSPGQLGPICCKSATALPTARTALRPRSGARHKCAHRTHAPPHTHTHDTRICVFILVRVSIRGDGLHFSYAYIVNTLMCARTGIFIASILRTAHPCSWHTGAARMRVILSNWTVRTRMLAW